jgi:hypothetical protein
VCTALTADVTRAHFVSQRSNSAAQLWYLRTSAIVSGVIDWSPDIAHLTGLDAAQNVVDEMLLMTMAM